MKIIYLDQNKWIDLAKICHKKDDKLEPNREHSLFL